MTLTNDQLTARDDLIGLIKATVARVERTPGEGEIVDSKPIDKGQVTHAAGFYVRVDGELFRVLVHKAHRVMRVVD